MYAQDATSNELKLNITGISAVLYYQRAVAYKRHCDPKPYHKRALITGLAGLVESVEWLY